MTNQLSTAAPVTDVNPPCACPPAEIDASTENLNHNHWQHVPNLAQPCYDCGSTLPLRHTSKCDLTGPDDRKDLPEIEDTQWWNKKRTYVEESLIPVGNTGLLQKMYEVRSPEQRVTVKEILASEEFKFACTNPFDADLGPYTGPFAFWFYNTEHTLVLVRIGKRGKILSRIEAKTGEPVKRINLKEAK